MATTYDVRHMYVECMRHLGTLQGLLGNSDPNVLSIRGDLETIANMIVPAPGRTVYEQGSRQFDMFYARLLAYHDYGGKQLANFIKMARDARSQRGTAPSPQPTARPQPSQASAPQRRQVDYLNLIDFGQGPILAVFRRTVRSKGGRLSTIVMFCQRSHQQCNAGERIDGLDAAQWRILWQTALQLQKVVSDAPRQGVEPFYDDVRLLD
jgi:hypothetical protein